MPIFDKFPLINYNGFTIKDISRRLYIDELIKNRTTVYDTYSVNEGEKIEDVSYKIYGDPEYHWVIMIMNDIVDPYFDWVLSTKELNLFIADNYPGTGNVANAPDGIHHWELNGILSLEVIGAVSISNKQYEDKVNESKRNIKILRKQYIPVIEEELSTVLST